MKPEMKARISQLHKTASEWKSYSEKRLSAGDPFIPSKGELIVYDPDESFNYPRVKVGDGELTLDLLPFFVEPVIKSALSELSRSEIIDAGCITDYLN